MDFYLSCPPHANGKLVANVPSAHYFVLQVLDLAVALFLDREDHNRVITEFEAQNERSGHKAPKEIALIVEAIFSMGTTVIESVDSGDWLLGLVSSSSLVRTTSSLM